jgi:hypothetical protein
MNVKPSLLPRGFTQSMHRTHMLITYHKTYIRPVSLWMIPTDLPFRRECLTQVEDRPRAVLLHVLLPLVHPHVARDCAGGAQGGEEGNALATTRQLPQRPARGSRDLDLLVMVS